jgi:hypothetical protein
MVWVPGGDFLMGSEDFYPEERPVHRVAVDEAAADLDRLISPEERLRVAMARQ